MVGALIFANVPSARENLCKLVAAHMVHASRRLARIAIDDAAGDDHTWFELHILFAGYFYKIRLPCCEIRMLIVNTGGPK